MGGSARCGGGGGGYAVWGEDAIDETKENTGWAWSGGRRASWEEDEGDNVPTFVPQQSPGSSCSPLASVELLTDLPSQRCPVHTKRYPTQVRLAIYLIMQRQREFCPNPVTTTATPTFDKSLLSGLPIEAARCSHTIHARIGLLTIRTQTTSVPTSCIHVDTRLAAVPRLPCAP